MKYEIREIFEDSVEQAFNDFKDIGATIPGSRIMADKLDIVILKVKDIDTRAANILKQEMLARSGDVVTTRDVLSSLGSKTDVIILGNRKSFDSLIKKLILQPFGLKALADDLNTFLEERDRKKPEKLWAGDYELDLENPLIMGILNVTPDSFSDGGKYLEKENAIKRTVQMIEQGADIIDVGGMSTRPGSSPVDEKEEQNRVLPIIEEIVKKYDFPVSIDTYRSGIAKRAIEAGACIVNDISALRFDDDMAKIVAKSNAAIVLMHMQGDPKNMQENPQYEDVVDEVYGFLMKRAGIAINEGIDKEKIIIDPGIGFGKKLAHNLKILSRLKDLTSLGHPLLLGVSRKSFIGMLSDTEVDQRLIGSIAASLWGVFNSADIIRVHDIKETKQALKVIQAIRDSG